MGFIFDLAFVWSWNKVGVTFTTKCRSVRTAIPWTQKLVQTATFWYRGLNSFYVIKIYDHTPHGVKTHKYGAMTKQHIVIPLVLNFGLRLCLSEVSLVSVLSY